MADDNNRHVKDYLTYYLSLPHSPYYAVMINGPWGIGKTYLVKQFLKEAISKPDVYVYVSLFGLATLDEIDGALIEAIYPFVGTKVTKIGARVVKAALKFKGIELDLKLSDLVDKFNPRIFVFDDLERCGAPINTVMGYINEFVEHNGCKVIIVANENEIAGGNRTEEDENKEQTEKGMKQVRERTEYLRRREKIVGKTLEVQSAFDEAFDFFVTQIDHSETKSLLTNNASDIRSIYSQSELNNLRILQQTMWDFERVSRALTKRQRENAEAMAALVRLTFALSFEIKAGRLRTADLRSRSDWLFAAMMQENGKDAASRRRYPEVDLADQVLSDDALVDILIRGIVDENSIRTCLDRSRYFVTVANERPWVTVWHMFDRTEEEFETAFKRMEEQFAARKFIDVGELLHVLALRLFLARHEISGKAILEVMDEGKRYINDLYHAGKINITAAEFRDLSFNAYGGLGFIESDSVEFQELSSYLRQRAEQAIKDRYPQMGLDLLKEMETDPDLYLRRVCLTNSSDNIYYDVPILASIDPDKFVQTLLSGHPSNQRTVLRAFGGRYEYGGLNRELAPEKQWLEAVQQKLIVAANAMSPMGRFRLLNGVGRNITQALNNIKKN